MKYAYGEYDGQPFPTPDLLFPPSKVVEFILQYGQDALDAMEKLDGDEEKQYIQALIDAGLLQKDEKTGKITMTPRMLKGIEQKSLLEIFKNLNRSGKEGHQTTDRGRSDERIEGTKPYEFGDPVSEIDVSTTLRNSLRRAVEESSRASAGSPGPGSFQGLSISTGDMELYLSEGQTDVATCILLDMSGSMMRYSRFYHAKRVALGLAALIRSKFPQDTVDYVGFYSTSCRITERELALVMPKPISTYDPSIRIRVPLQQALENPKRIPQHFTNLQLGLRTARQILSRRGAAQKQVFVITDGQPTAHIEPNPAGGDMLHLIYPPSERTTDATLKEALRCHQAGIRIATFALIEDYWGMDWVHFVDQMTRLTRGAAFYCASPELGSTVIESYLSGKKKKSYSK